MKKNVLRVISLVLVAGMLFAFSSCTQKIQISFVDAQGNVINPFGGGTASTGNAGTGNAGTGNTGTGNSAVDEIETAPQGEGTIGGDDIEIQEGVMPATTVDIINFYTAGVKAIKNDGAAGYTKKEWQNVDSVNIGAAKVNEAVTSVLGNFMTTEDQAGEQINDKGSDDAKNRFPDWTLTDINMVAGAECKDNGDGNYKITIIMKDEDTPKKEGSVLGQVTNSLLYWEDIDNTLSTDSTVTAILNSYSDIHVVYKNYTISAVMTPDGKFVSLDHTADVDILIGQATILFVFKIENKSGHMWNYCKYYNFVY